MFRAYEGCSNGEFCVVCLKNNFVIGVHTDGQKCSDIYVL